jgi:hypothetical protein
MSTAKAPRLSPIAQQAASFLRLFRGGVFEDNFLDVSGLDAGAWESARAELEEAALITVEWGVLLAGRPYLRLPAKMAPVTMGPSSTFRAPNPGALRAPGPWRRGRFQGTARPRARCGPGTPRFTAPR